MAEGRRGRRLVSLFGADVLLVALSAGLTALDWTCVSGDATNPMPADAAVVLVDNHALSDRNVIVELAVRPIPIVAIGSVRRPLSMIAAVRAGATDVVDADLPFIDLLEAVMRGLVQRPPVSAGGAARRRRLLDALLDRHRDEQLLGRLTPREQQVLRALAVGRSAGEIAGEERLSVATVRSHVQAVLRKLEVSSQLAAVAIGRRGWRDLGVVDQQVEAVRGRPSPHQF
ncbi:response regulator transcription factor [Saccharothrix deserti]|uniref:response regulator transcription factor n=1 Tax=Saccharothrix deserti TaxID=2593674 RepID=UPI00131C49A3|nr:LuxR C-terminal-related transcriptional regulator [Saccharothrix deserti]